MNSNTPLWKAHDASQLLQDLIEALPNVERAFVHVDHEATHTPVRLSHFNSSAFQANNCSSVLPENDFYELTLLKHRNIERLSMDDIWINPNRTQRRTQSYIFFVQIAVVSSASRQPCDLNCANYHTNPNP